MSAIHREAPGATSRRQTAGRGAKDSSGSRGEYFAFRFEGAEGESRRVEARTFGLFVLFLGLLGPGSLQRDGDREL